MKDKQRKGRGIKRMERRKGIERKKGEKYSSVKKAGSEEGTKVTTRKIMWKEERNDDNQKGGKERGA